MKAGSDDKRLLRTTAMYVALMLLLAYLMPKELNWSPSFSREHNWPYGADILYDRLSDIFPGTSIITADRPIYNTLKDTVFDEATNYVFVSDRFFLDSLDQHYLMDFVANGNSAFISAEIIDPDLIDTLALETSMAWVTDFQADARATQSDLHLNFLNPTLRRDSAYAFRAVRQYRHFDNADSLDINVALGSINEDRVVFVRVPFGDGSFYLHYFPYAFTNYHMLKATNAEYVSTCLSYLDVRSLIWDEYYKFGTRNFRASPMSTLLRSPAFRWAYWISLISLLVFMLFYAKRRQRVIPVLKPFRNESLAFTKTISDLYFQQGNHRNVAAKKIAVFKEHLNRKHALDNIRFSSEEAEMVALKTGHDITFVVRLFKAVRRILDSEGMHSNQMVTLSHLLNTFYGR